MGQLRAIWRTRQQMLASLAVMAVLLAACGRSAPADEVAGADPDSPVTADPTESTATGAPADNGVESTVSGGETTQEPAQATGSTEPATTTTQAIVPGAGSAVHGPNEAGVRVLSEGPIVALPAPAQPGATPSVDPGSGQTYVVEPGDTLSGIAAKFGLAIDAIAGANNITDVDDIKPGQELIIPAAAVEQPDQATDQPAPATEQPAPATDQ